MSEILKDQAERDMIIRETKRNIFVEAGAGSGKTTILVERMVAMVESGIPISSISAITFTKAAANEFYERFQKRLVERSHEKEEDYIEGPAKLPRPTELSRKRCEEALRNIDLCFLGTIDSFCSLLLSEYPSEASIPSSAGTHEEKEMAEIYSRHYSLIKDGSYGEELREKALAFEGLLDSSKDARDLFVFLLGKMMDLRNGTFDYPEITEGFEDYFKEEKALLLGAFSELRKKSGFRLSGTKKNEESWEYFLRNDIEEDLEDNAVISIYNDLKAIKGMRLIYDEEAMETTADIRKLFSPHQNSRIKKEVVYDYYHFEETADEMIRKIDNYRLSRAASFVEECLPALSERMREEGSLSFFDYLLYLRDTLKKDAGTEGRLIRQIQKKRRYYLIDEFQDTNPIQAEIFFYLSAETIEEDWRNCVPYPGSLFIVGDPKQSIYRFRNADIASFKRVGEMFEKEGCSSLKLNTNFRSAPSVCDWFRETFRKILSEDTEDQCAFEDIYAGRKEDTEGTLCGVYSYPVNKDKGKKNDEDRKIVEIIRRLVNNDAILIQDRGQRRKIRYGDFMIITEKKASTSEIGAILHKEGIACRIEGDMSLKDCPALLDVIAIYGAAVRKDSRKYAAAMAKAACFGYEDKELYPLLEDMTKEEVPEDSLEALRRSLIAKKDSCSPSALFKKAADEAEVFAKSDPSNIEYFYYVLSLLRDGEKNGTILSHEDALEYLEGLRDGEEKLERCGVLYESQDRVHIANVHKVKGLQNKIVILASPQKKRAREADMRTEYEDGPETVFFNLTISGNKKIKTSYAEERREKEAVSAEAEKDRILYVAATRAKKVLIIADLYHDGSREESSWSKLLEAGPHEDILSLTENSYGKVKGREKIDAKDLYELAKKEDIRKDYENTSSYRLLAPSRLDEEIKGDYEGGSGKRDPKLIGSLVHKLMEDLVSSKGRLDKENLIQAALSSLAEEDDGYYRNILNDVYETIAKGGYPQEEGEGDILKLLLEAEEVYTEVPFSYREGRDVWNGVIDVLYRKEGLWHIVDYKTDHEYQAHETQLSAYEKAVERLLGVKADARIYHIPI